MVVGGEGGIYEAVSSLIPSIHLDYYYWLLTNVHVRGWDAMWQMLFFFFFLPLSFPPSCSFSSNQHHNLLPPLPLVTHCTVTHPPHHLQWFAWPDVTWLTNPPIPPDTHTILPSSHPGVMEAFVKQRNVASLQKITAFWVTGPLESGIVHGKKQGTQKLCWIISACEVESKCFFIISQNCNFFFLFPFFWKDYPIIETHSVCN